MVLKKTILVGGIGILSNLLPTTQTHAKMKTNNKQANGMEIEQGKLIYSEIKINASASKIWGIFTNFGQYPQWNPFIKSLQTNGDMVIGGRICVFLQPAGAKGMQFKPKVLVFDGNKEFRWIGNLLIPGLFDGEHTFKITENPDGSCTFMQYERFGGILIPFFKKMLEVDTQEGFNQMNRALKQLCEAD